MTSDPPAPHVTLDDLLLLLSAVIADLDIIVERNRRPGRLPADDPAAHIAGQIRTLNRADDPFSLGVRGCLAGIAAGVERAARRGLEGT